MGLLSLSHDGPGSAVADLDLCVFEAKRACAPAQHDGAGRKSKVRIANIYFLGVAEKSRYALSITFNCYYTH